MTQLLHKIGDLGYCLSKYITPYLLQVRAITTVPNWNRALSNKIDAYLLGIKSLVKERFKRASGRHLKVSVA